MVTPWQGNTQGALAYLALLARGQNPAGATPFVPPITAADVTWPNYDRHIYVSHKAGSDVAAAERGRIGLPWKSLQAACNSVKPPTTAEQQRDVYVFHVMDAPKVVLTTGARITLPRSRRIVLHAPNVHLPDLVWNVDMADSAAIAQPAELVITGDAGFADFDSNIGTLNGVGTCVVGNDNGGNGAAITLNSVGVADSSALLYLDNVGLYGGITSAPSTKSDWVAGAPFYRARNTGFFNPGSGLGIVSTSTGKPTLGQLLNCYLQDAYPITVQTLQGISGGYCGADITVVAVAADALNTGLVGVKFSAATKWTGPNSSCFLDSITNYWCVAKGSTVLTAKKVMLFNDTP